MVHHLRLSGRPGFPQGVGEVLRRSSKLFSEAVYDASRPVVFQALRKPGNKFVQDLCSRRLGELPVMQENRSCQRKAQSSYGLPRWNLLMEEVNILGVRIIRI